MDACRASDVWQRVQGPLLYAHRGACLEHPENTLPAFVAARALGADALEIDVHMTRDGVIVVSHDSHGHRTAGVRKAIADCSFAEISCWDVGRTFGTLARPPQHDRAPARIPALAQVLSELPQMPLNVDLKQRRPSMVERVVGLLREHAASERVLLTSFDAATIAHVRALGYPGPTGAGRRDVVTAWMAPEPLLRRVALGAQRLQIPLRAGPVPLDRRALIDKWHAVGLAVDYWVVNQPARAQQLLDRGADGIVSDDPRSMAAVFARHPRAQGWRRRHAEVAA